jgi:Uma2 family endonuclease
MMTLETVRQITVADYHKMGEMGMIASDERVELIEGVIHVMAPIGAVHTWTVTQLTKVLVYSFGTEYAIGIQNPIILSDDNEPQPDGCVVKLLEKGSRPEIPRAEDVYLVVEVSDSTLTHDRTVKVPLYATAGIPEVWIVDTTASLIEQYLSPQGGTYQVVQTWRKGDAIPTSLGVEIEVDDILL